jgi:hypothetical protein
VEENMGIRDWFAKKPSASPSSRGEGAAPSAEFPTPLSLIRAMLERYPAVGEDGDWITFVGKADGREAIVEVSGESINLCKTSVDLPAVLRQVGLAGLAEAARAGGRKNEDRTMWELSKAAPEELAAAIHAAFSRGLGLGETYSLTAEHQS